MVGFPNAGSAGSTATWVTTTATGLPATGEQLGRGERADLGLRLRDGDPERQRRRLGRPQLLAQELVPDLGAVPVRDHDLALEQRRDRGEGRGEVRPVLGGGPALPGPEERVPAQRDDRQHDADRDERLCFTSIGKAMAVSAKDRRPFRGGEPPFLFVRVEHKHGFRRRGRLSGPPR